MKTKPLHVTLIGIIVLSACVALYALWPRSIFGMYEATYPHLEGDERFSGYVWIEEHRLSGDGLIVPVGQWVFTKTHATAYQPDGRMAGQFELRDQGTLGMATPTGMLLLTPIKP